MAATNILTECTCSIKFSATDLGGGEVYSEVITFKADTVTVRESITTADHSTAQDQFEMHRMTKATWDVDVETKLYNSSLLAALRSNALAEIIVTAPTGLGVDAKGIITGVEASYAGPSTMKFSLKCHGSAVTYA